MNDKNKTIPYGKPVIGKHDIKIVLDVLSSDWISQGPMLNEFEKRVANYCGVKYAVAVSSGTAALHLAAIVAGLSGGKRFWTSALTFVASANCGLYTGAEVDFVDINSTNYNIDLGELERKLERAEGEGTLPNVLIPVHFAGLSCSMKRIAELAHRYNIRVIEDACHALGSEYLKEKVGCCCYSDMAVFSFHPLKSITTGEGGMILTNNVEYYERLKRLRNHGITKNDDLIMDRYGPWYYEQQELGFNYRITDIQCALGFAQMDRLDEFVTRRRELAAVYDGLLKDMPVSPQESDGDCLSSYHLYVIRFNTDEIALSRREIFERMRKSGIGIQVHYIPIPAQYFYRRLGFDLKMFPEAKKYYDEAISLPLYPTLREKEVQRVVNTLKTILEVK